LDRKIIAMWRSTATAIDRVRPTWIEPSIPEDIRRSLLRAIALTGGSSRGFKFVSGKKTMRTVSNADSVFAA
jgi:hypothetical protein